MKRKIIFITILLAAALSAQSVHQYFYEKERTQKELAMNKARLPLSSEKIKKKNLSKTVFGFLPDWEYVSDTKNYLRFDLLTHIAVFGFTADTLGGLTLPLAWPWNDLIEAAHANNVKVVMSVISFDNNTTHTLLTSEEARDGLFANIASVISENNLDGVNLDFEGLYESDRGDLLNNFVSELNSYLDENLEVSFDAPAWNWGGWNFEGLAAACDYLFVMEYDYFGAWSETSGPSAPLTGSGINVTRSIDEQFAAVPSEKIILGVPYYGIHWKTENDNENSETTNFLDYLSYRTVKSGYDWNEKRWSQNYSVPWLSWREDSTHQIWYDNTESLGAKYDFAVSRNLKGVGIWALGFDGNRTELWDLINNKFGDGNEIRPEPPVAFSVRGIEQNGEIFAELKFSSSPRAIGYIVYESSDGVIFDDSTTVNDTLVLLPREDLQAGILNTRYYKVKAVNSGGISSATTTLAVNSYDGNPATDKTFLIVDGFDRYYGNGNKFDYITKTAPLFDEYGIPFYSANNEAIIRGFEPPSPFLYWLLGNESRKTETLNYAEQQFIRTVFDSIDCYARLFISGSELGYDLSDEDFSTWFDEEFYSEILHAEYVSDAPDNMPYTYYTIENVAGSAIDYSGTFSFDNGTNGTFNVGYPDAIKSAVADSSNDLKYVNVNPNEGFAGISYGDEYERTVYFGFPLETVYDENRKKELFEKAFDFLLDGITDVENDSRKNFKFELAQNYPNPFNPTTTISYSLPVTSGVEASRFGGTVALHVFNSLGQKVATLVNKKQAPGEYSVRFDASDLPSGVYFYTLRAGEFVTTKKMILLK